MNYEQMALDDARTMFKEFVEEMCEQWAESRTVSTDFNNDYSNGDEYHHSSHVDKEYKLSEAAAVLQQLAAFEETDSGLWRGLEPRVAISAQAAYTYGNAVAAMWCGIVEEVNEKMAELCNDDNEDNVTLAGQRYLRLYALLLDFEEKDCEGMVSVALNDASKGGLTASLVLADWLQENDRDHKATQIRQVMQ